MNAVPGFFPNLDDDALRRLRRLVAGLGGDHRKPVPRGTILELADELGGGCGVTIDFAAAEALGQPMVVLHAPASPDGGGARAAGVSESAAGPLRMLSRREMEIAGLVADGLSNKQIAGRLHIALSTVKDHVHRILVKTGLPNRAAVAAATFHASADRVGATSASAENGTSDRGARRSPHHSRAGS